MTPEELEKAVWESRCDTFAQALNALDDAQRKSLLPTVKAVHRRVSREPDRITDGFLDGDHRKAQAAHDRWQAGHVRIETNSVLAVLACGAAADAHRVELWPRHEGFEVLIPEVLIARKPGWLVTWVNKRLDGEFPDLSWNMVRRLMQAGVIEKPVSEGYTSLFVDAMRSYDQDNPASYVPTSERLRRQPELLEDEVWRIFEFETPALLPDWHGTYGPTSPDYQTWPEALVDLAVNGDIDRGRLLDATLEGMQREMKQNHLSAFGKLHEALAPTTEEMRVRQQAYLDLLVSPTGLVLSFAVRMLRKLHRAGKLKADAFVSGARPVFAHKAKGTATQTLKILEKFATAGEVSFTRTAELAVAAMAHPSPDVQELALGILANGIDDCDQAVRDDVERHIPFLSAKLKSRATELLGKSEDEREASPRPEVGENIDLKARLASLPPGLCKLLGGEEAAEDVMPPPLVFQLTDLPGVANPERLEPVGSRDELLELTAQLVERVESPDQVEVLLHGISRFGQDRGGNFDRFVAPLIQRITSGATSMDSLRMASGATYAAMIDLLMSWWKGKRYDSTRSDYYIEVPEVAFAAARVREIQQVPLGDSSSEILSFPSFRTGWIDPEEFVERIIARKEDEKFSRYDLMQAFLRLGPGDREQALRAAQGIGSNAGRLVRFALGGDERPAAEDRREAQFWYCAALARDPQLKNTGHLDEIDREIPKMPGALPEEKWSWEVRTETQHSFSYSHIALDSNVTSIDMGFEFTPDLLRKTKRKPKDPTWSNWPTVGIRSWPDGPWETMYLHTAPWSLRWLGMQHPADTESYMCIAVRMLDFRSDENTKRHMPAYAAFATLFDATRPWGEITRLAVGLGLLSRSSDSRGFAADALIPAIESGHADWRRFAVVFSKLLANGAYKINRFGPSMAVVLDVSDLHKWWVGSLIDELVVQLGSPPKAAYFLYETALECMLPLKLRPSESMAAVLKTHKGSSKTAKLARELLALEGPTIHEPGTGLIAEAWLGRLAFADAATGARR